MLERIRADLAEAHIGDHPRSPRASASPTPTQAETLEQLLRIADGGLYSIQGDGRDRVTVGEPMAETPILSETRDETAAPGNGRPRPQTSQPPLHDAIDDEDPRPSGREIR